MVFSLDKRLQKHTLSQCKFQSMGERPWATKSSLHLEKCLDPNHPREAESGDGWTEVSTWCFFLSIRAPLSCAGLPQSRKTTPDFSALILATTASVNFYPIPLLN
eukprot:TRINITY_DN2730_c0_g1_i1.p1 TRINITY_DN2730_c0_g1~~TRINITY_DN2730_c0_g1_i1.p1  ORF type:complete len:114 (+),score=7.55 TRINITY_DN2730_c0_g1_i1:29-343(+)